MTVPRFRVRQGVVHRAVDGEMVLLDLVTEQYFGLDPVGTRIVTRITTEPYDQAITALHAEFDVAEDTLRRDVEDLLDELIANGLVEPVLEAES